jgi:hypothetical protein
VIDPQATLDIEQTQTEAREVARRDAQLLDAADAAENAPARGLAVECVPCGGVACAPPVADAPALREAVAAQAAQVAALYRRKTKAPLARRAVRATIRARGERS